MAAAEVFDDAGAALDPGGGCFQLHKFGRRVWRLGFRLRRQLQRDPGWDLFDFCQCAIERS